MAEKKEKKEEKEKKEKKSGSGILFKIVLIVLLLLIALALGFVGYTLFSKKTPIVINSTTQTQTATKNSAAETTLYTNTLDEFLVNLADDGGKKYIKIKVSLGYDTKDKKKMDKELEDKNANIRDAIISILRSKVSTDIANQQGIDNMKKEMMTKLNAFLKYGKVEDIYINDILVQ